MSRDRIGCPVVMHCYLIKAVPMFSKVCLYLIKKLKFKEFSEQCQTKEFFNYSLAYVQSTFVHLYNTCDTYTNTHLPS